MARAVLLAQVADDKRAVDVAYPQRPAGLIEECFAEQSRRWTPILKSGGVMRLDPVPEETGRDRDE